MNIAYKQKNNKNLIIIDKKSITEYEKNNKNCSININELTEFLEKISFENFELGDKLFYSSFSETQFYNFKITNYNKDDLLNVIVLEII